MLPGPNIATPNENGGRIPDPLSLKIIKVFSSRSGWANQILDALKPWGCRGDEDESCGKTGSLFGYPEGGFVVIYVATLTMRLTRHGLGNSEKRLISIAYFRKLNIKTQRSVIHLSKEGKYALTRISEMCEISISLARKLHSHFPKK